MAGEQRRLHALEDEDPIWRLWSQLPESWQGPVIGDGIVDWERITENGDRRIELRGLPDPIPAELAWMSHWQASDGTRSSVLGTNQFANILRRAAARTGQTGLLPPVLDHRHLQPLHRRLDGRRPRRRPDRRLPAQPRTVRQQATHPADHSHQHVDQPAGRPGRRPVITSDAGDPASLDKP